MKVIENKKTEIKGNFESVDGIFIERKANYSDLLRIVMNTVPQGGITISDMRKDIRITDALDKADNEQENIILEDSDYNRLSDKLRGFSWGFMNKELITFEDYILSFN